MSLHARLAEYVRACFTGLWIQSHEHEDALKEIAQLCDQEQWRLATWNIDAGLSLGGAPGPAPAPAPAPGHWTYLPGVEIRWLPFGRSAHWPRPNHRPCWCW